ncbi:TBCC domain-containing protein 1 isoform X1 [Histomonas meleagridis]|uniref:TBCC domain-containing protein 1 isoform X1 n=1 Tax=Histomonas meleagridis TaxID=135588 RepID=UPI0035593E4B|nr:TBCC domain-containing protein 1 isoform X1 [Histomonas meleagridis]KAH0798270.1 TBCC domain-containing protein 1 isoform X1 [Histomonas meleagridis]
MSELSSKLCLNWEVFELAAIPTFCTTEISLEKIRRFAQNFEDLTDILPFKKFKDTVSQIFKFNENQVQAIYSTLTCFITKDANEALLQSQLYLADPSCLPSHTLRVTDMLCFLFALLVKKKFRGVSEISNLEAFPSKSIPKLSPMSSRLSASDTSVTRVMTLKSPLKSRQEHSPLQLMLRYFLKEFPQFLQLYAPKGLTKIHLQSLSFLIIAWIGPSYNHRFSDLIVALDLLQDCEIESTAKFEHLVYALLSILKESDLRDTAFTSPVAYRPSPPRAVQDLETDQTIILDKPILIEKRSQHYEFVDPSSPCEVFIHDCRHSTIYICGPVSCVFISNCKDSTVFVGAATCVHMSYGLNNKVIAASRMVHLDACTRCTSYLLTNTKPLLTGNCTRITLAPYNALYTKFGLDILSIGINPQLNFWGDPIVMGSLGVSQFEKMAPERFSLFSVVFNWEKTASVINPIIPPEYLQGLENKRKKILSLKADLDRIKEKSPDLFNKLVQEFKNYSNKLVADEGVMQQANWLYTLFQEE